MAKKADETDSGSELGTGEDTGVFAKLKALFAKLCADHERLQSWGIILGMFTSIVGVAIAAVSVYVAAARYSHTVTQYVQMEKRFSEEDRRKIFDGLAASETRYQGERPFGLFEGGMQHTLQLEIYFKGVKGEYRAFFRLPRASQIRTETRTRNVKGADGELMTQEYVVQIPVYEGPVAVQVSPFGCVECESASRLDYFRQAQRITDVQLPADHIRIARAGIDFGELELAQYHLSRAVEAAANSDLPSIVISRAYVDVGKTYYILRDLESGREFLDKGKSLLRVNAREGQLGELHAVLSWEAQFAATRHDHSDLDALLSEFAATVDGYQVGESMTSKMIQDTYAICLAIRSSYHEFDPVISVPKEYKEYLPSAGGWVRPISVANTNDRNEVPAFFKWQSED
ncbi:hypothetical protein FF011L_12590 [Roseimaritima multifibrata]|uniref:Uncharacterized protein n=1 Tax=Roseimaritima multifibrata TaxID=1930274 RepID=A0A517MC93_9BACT|nr:hypothetical protein [Roseimaritima multifibrata]QDS92513.1 hypothetical protein FF011L_12590 [Roseimaritima multifibrata]